MILHPIIDLLKRIVVDLPEYVKPSGGSQTITATFDNVISTNGGRTAPFYAIANLLQFRNFEAVGYAYRKGQTSAYVDYRINYGLTSTQFTSGFRINQDGDTTTKFKLTGVTENGVITYKYYYNDVLIQTSQSNDAYNGFAFHWLSDVDADTEIVIHVDITGT